MADFKLVDVWRETHKLLREYSFYSHAIKSYSRIDIFLAHVEKVHLISSCEYLAMTHSDHAPLMLLIAQKYIASSVRLWRFPIQLLNDADYVKVIRNNIESFLSINKGTASPIIVWESLKAYLRGETISYTSWKKKQHLLKTKTLESEIRVLEMEHFQMQNERTYEILNNKRIEYDLLTTQMVENAMARTKRQYYEHGDKCGTLLAWQIRNEDSSRCISSVRIKDGATVVHDPKLINETFKDSYLDLYSSKGVDTRKIDSFLEGLS